jgi:membrane protein YdbS with pleckstrin-like domain
MKKSRSIKEGTERGHDLDAEPNEKVIHDTRPAIMSWTGPLVFGWLVVPVLYSLWRHRCTRYMITTDRIVIRRHRLTKEHTGLTYSEISAVRTKKRLSEWYTQTGTIELTTASEEQIVLKAVPDHATVAETIRDLISSPDHEIE